MARFKRPGLSPAWPSRLCYTSLMDIVVGAALACLALLLLLEWLASRRESSGSEDLNVKFRERLRRLDGQGPFPGRE